MSITKFDLYNPGWLELVFANRNKDYGAYDLRKHYAGNLLRAMGIAFFSVGIAIASFLIFHISGPAPVIHDSTIKVIPVVLDPRVQAPKAATSAKPPSASTIKNTTMVVAPDPVSENPVTLDQIKGKATGPETTPGKDDGEIVIPEAPKGKGSSKVDDSPIDAGVLELMPEPYGGATAWARFLQKNIHYPSQASQAGKQGKVFLSFIVETDGHLSNIVVETGVGYGLDEEALRVLKLAPAWKPGIQNGQKVRVKYTIPINFQIADPD
ncbi:MAG: energy transducer TonB [Mucilaginibacter sp.]|nr:energy transducer TonB [Mucilaginibacter sp.]